MIRLCHISGQLSARLCYQIQINPDRFPSRDAISRWWNPETMALLARALAKVEEYIDELCSWKMIAA